MREFPSNAHTTEFGYSDQHVLVFRAAVLRVPASRVAQGGCAKQAKTGLEQVPLHGTSSKIYRLTSVWLRRPPDPSIVGEVNFVAYRHNHVGMLVKDRGKGPE